MAGRTVTLPEQHLKMLVKETVRETFLNLGLNIADPDDIIEYQKDLHFTRGARLQKEATITSAWLTFVKVLISGICAAIILRGSQILQGHS